MNFAIQGAYGRVQQRKPHVRGWVEGLYGDLLSARLKFTAVERDSEAVITGDLARFVCSCVLLEVAVDDGDSHG